MFKITTYELKMKPSKNAKMCLILVFHCDNKLLVGPPPGQAFNIILSSTIRAIVRKVQGLALVSKEHKESTLNN